MPINKSVDQANGAPRYAIIDNKTANGETMYGNTTLDSFVTNQRVGVFGVDATEIGISPNKLTRITIVSGGTGYNNTDILTVVGATTNANATITTNSTGGITALTIANNGVGINVYSTYTIANSTGGASGGSSANLVLGLPEGKRVAHTGWVKRVEGTGGRQGRIHYEVLVAGGISSDGSDDTIFADS